MDKISNQKLPEVAAAAALGKGRGQQPPIQPKKDSLTLEYGEDVPLNRAICDCSNGGNGNEKKIKSLFRDPNLRVTHKALGRQALLENENLRLEKYRQYLMEF